MSAVIKEWPVSIWVVLRNGQPFDYAYSRASAFAEAREQRVAHPLQFWSITPAKGTLRIEVKP
jgi:hypothetical protein